MTLSLTLAATLGRRSMGATVRRPTVLVVVFALYLLVAWPATAEAETSSAADRTAASVAVTVATASSVLYFVYLGDIWRYDVAAGTVVIEEAAAGRCLGHVSWSADGRARAWEERTTVDGRAQSRVVFRRGASSPGGPDDVREFPAAAAPAVSADGRYLLYETRVGDVTSLVIFDAAGRPVPGPVQGARNGSWVEGPGGVTAAVAFDREGTGVSSEGFYLLDLVTEKVLVRRVSVAGPANVQPGRWDPLAGSVGAGFLVASFGADGRRYVLQTGDTAAPAPLLDVTSADHFDYRWRYTPAGGSVPYVELAPLAVGRSDIYEVRGAAEGRAPTMVLTDSSFGWNASLSPAVPFGDLQPDSPFYDAVALLWAQGVVQGFSDGTFRAAQPVNRAQFAKMLGGAMGIEVYPGLPRPPFRDLPGGDGALYPQAYVSAAYGSGLVKGYKDGTFQPWSGISRAEMVTMAVRAARVYLPGGLSDPPAGWAGQTSGYTDAVHGGAVHAAEHAGLLAGIDLSGWDPGRPAGRGEVARLLLNLQRLRGPLVDSTRPPIFSVGTRRLGQEVQAAPAARERIGRIVFDGDSLTAGSTATDPYPSQIMRVFRPGVKWVNFGIGGQTITTMLGNAPTKVDPLYTGGAGRQVVVIWGGTNDLRWWAHIPEIIYRDLRNYCLGRRAQGFTVVALTMLPRTDGAYPPGFESDRQRFNAMMRTGWAGFADVLIDVGSDSYLGQFGCEVDTRFFSGDRVHLNNGGLALVAGRVRALLERIDARGGS